MIRYVFAILMLFAINYSYSIAYKEVYLKSFSYLGSNYRIVPLLVHVMSTLLAFINYYQITKIRSGQISLFLAIFFLFSFVAVPVTSWMITDWDILRWIKINIIYAILMSLIVQVGKIKLPEFTAKISYGNVTGLLYPVFLGFIIVILYFSLNITFNLDFASIYDRRLAARDATPVTLKYVISNTIAAVLPLSVLLAYKSKNLITGLFAALLMILIFSYEGSKSVFFKPAAGVLLIYLVNRISAKNAMDFLLLIYTTISVFLALMASRIGNEFLNLILHRSYFLPGKLIVWYLEIFDNGVTLGDFKTPAYLVGSKYLNNPEINANSNFIVSSLVELGFIYTVLITIVASLLATILLKKDMSSFGKMIAILMALTLAESDFFTSLGNHGILLLLFYKETFKKSVNGYMY